MKNNGGFTLIESMVSLFVYAIIFLLLHGIFQSLQYFNQNFHADKNTEWHLYLNQLENHTEDYVLTQRSRSNLRFQHKEDKNEIFFRLEQGEIRRPTPSGGYFPVLTRVRDVIYSDGEDGVHIEVQFVNGQTMRGFVSVERKE